MTIGCNILVICLILIWFCYGLSRMFQLPQFVLALRSSVWDVFINFLLIEATDRIKIRSDQKRLFFAVSLYPLSFFTNTPFNFPGVTENKNFHTVFLNPEHIYDLREICSSYFTLVNIYIWHTIFSEKNMDFSAIYVREQKDKGYRYQSDQPL